MVLLFLCGVKCVLTSKWPEFTSKTAKLTSKCPEFTSKTPKLTSKAQSSKGD
ncbi:hypothetical protein [Peribacillus sp. NPDC096448]|uniref:hypothetical protein n=1 Tax=Peribacillus sp. NPDC096448 TaxID=3364395 RepID=UPI003816527E